MGQHNLDENLPNLAPQFLHRTAQFLQEHWRCRFAFEDWSRNQQVSGIDLAIPEVNHLISVLPPEFAQVKQGFEATLIMLIELQRRTGEPTVTAPCDEKKSQQHFHKQYVSVSLGAIVDSGGSLGRLQDLSLCFSSPSGQLFLDTSACFFLFGWWLFRPFWTW